jgi:uncharacterized membrane-anchored protein
LQETVEGLSVVAISYYAVSLAAYLLAPLEPVLALVLGSATGLDKSILTAAAVIPVVGLVWWLIRRMRKRIGGPGR